MQSLVCPDWETKSISHKWQVSFKPRPGKRGRKFKVYRSADSASRKSDELYARGIQSRIEPVLTDFYIVNDDGQIVLAYSRLHPLDAAKVAYDYAGIDRDSGAFLWPHGSEFPTSLQSRVVVADKQMEVVS